MLYTAHHQRVWNQYHHYNSHASIAYNSNPPSFKTMPNTTYYQSLSKAYEEVCRRSASTHRVPNAVRQLSQIYEGRSLQDIVSKREPGEPVKTQYQRVDKKAYDADMKVWKQRSQQQVSRDRLKRKGAVPTKAGKRLFEDFMKDANRASGKKQVVRNREDLQQVYLSARALDFDKWLVFITEML